jgi:hypothetical protein
VSIVEIIKHPMNSENVTLLFMEDEGVVVVCLNVLSDSGVEDMSTTKELS